MESKMTVNELGAKEWRNENGKLHREDGPAIIYTNGSKEWWLNGKLHREDGPAIVRSNGTRIWKNKNGKLHREDGPAVIFSDGTIEWYINGMLHREDGPALILPNGTKEYWLNDKEYPKTQYQEKVRKQKLSKLKF